MCDTRLPRRRRDVHGGVVLAAPCGLEPSWWSSSADPRWRASARLRWRRFPRGTAFADGSSVGRPTSGERGLTDERLRLLEGLSYRAAMALQKARLARHREQSLHVADALLEFARALARAEETTSRSASCAWRRRCSRHGRCRSGFRPLPGRSSRPLPSGTTTRSIVRSCWRATLRGRGRTAVLGAARAIRAPTRAVHRRSRRDGARPWGSVAVAPFTLDNGRMGFLVAGSAAGETFGELQLKMLAGLADQATLAVSRSR